MRKLKLDPDALRVESFMPEAHLTDAGTVHAHDDATVGATCRTNCDCTLACPSIAPCTIITG